MILQNFIFHLFLQESTAFSGKLTHGCLSGLGWRLLLPGTGGGISVLQSAKGGGGDCLEVAPRVAQFRRGK